jgi:hypothetical protein
MDRRQKSGKKATQRRAPAGLIFKAAKAFLENQQTIESFIRELENKEEDLSKFSVGQVSRGVGESHFIVTLIPSGERVPSAGILSYLKHGTPASGTFIGPDSMVLVHDSRTGPMNRGRTHTIVAVLSAHQVEAILSMMGVAPREEDDLFDRTIEAAAIQAEVAKAEANLAAMRRSTAATRKASSNSSGSGSAAASRKSSSSYVNIDEAVAEKDADIKRAKKLRQTKRRMERKKAEKAAAATGAGGEGGEVTKWY